MRNALLILVAWVAAACATSPSPAVVPTVPTLAATIDAAVDAPPFDRAFWNILIEGEDGTVLYSRNAGKLAIPASNRKLFSAAAVASCLGVDARLTTEVWRSGEDLVVRGDGDPSLGSWRYERSDDFDRLAQDLAARGIKRVRDVIADVSAFDRVTIPGGWKHGNMGEDYAAPVDAIAWGENEIPGDRAVDDPALHAATALRDALSARGIEVTGSPRVNTEPRQWDERIATIPSPFLADLLLAVLKNSHNLYAEMILKRLATQPQASYQEALEIERRFLTSDVGLEPDSFSFVDGSGLAPDDLVTPESTIRILRWMNEPARRAFWWDILAQPAGPGTLRRRVVALEHRMRGKTGTINAVNALSGIVAMPDGRYRYFAAMVNHHLDDGDDAVRILDEIALAVAGHSEATTASREE